MKLNKILALALTTFAFCGFTSCSDDDDPEYFNTVDLGQITDFNAENYWAKCYDVTAKAVTADGYSFSHSAEETVYDGVTYKSWKGFCPSRVNDTADHSDDWVANQWGCMVANPNNAMYMVCNTNSVVSENPLENTDCVIKKADGSSFRPAYIYIANSSYFYYCAKDGSAFQEPFNISSWAKVNFVGVRNGQVVSTVEQYIAVGTKFINGWVPVYLDQMGTVDSLYIYFDSNVKNAYGITVPTYFCLSSLAYKI